jgi:ribose 5-phosphate isomerase A
LSPALGSRFPLPLEVIAFGAQATARFVAGLGAKVAFRRTSSGAFFRTDQGNYILDCAFGPIDDLDGLAFTLERRAGIVEHGLFLDLVSDVIVAGEDGVRHLRASASPREAPCSGRGKPAR